MSDDARDETPGPASFLAALGDFLFGRTEGRNQENEFRESLRDATGDEMVLLRNITRFGNIRVGEVMTPRTDMVAIEAGTTLAGTVSLFRSVRHSRLPVYRESMDQPVGVVHVRDLLAYWQDPPPPGPFSLDNIARSPLYVPPSMPIVNLLRRMQHERTHMALVVDEYGGIDGLVTIEDLVEEIVGEIADEHDDVEASSYHVLPDGTIEAEGRTLIGDVGGLLGIDLLGDVDVDEHIETIGGLVTAVEGRVPRTGETVRHPAGLLFEIRDADPRRVKRVHIRVMSPQQEGE